MVNVGVLIGKGLLWIFVIFMVGILGFVAYTFFKRLKQYLGIQSKNILGKEYQRPQLPYAKLTPKDKQSKGNFCRSCGSQSMKEDSFCSGCGREV